MRFLFLLFSLFLISGLYGQTVLKKGQKISRSLSVKPAQYHLPADSSLSVGVIEISGQNMIIDFKNATLDGRQGSQKPDTYQGLAILVSGGKNITIRNLNVRGYKVGLLAKNVDGLVLEHCNLSYNYRQQLKSTQEQEDLSDRLNYATNEPEQWLRFGAGIYLKNCISPVLSGCTVRNGQNGLLLEGCREALIYNNDFSFNSGLGLGLYQSIHNRILYNNLDFNVRGFSNGVYNSGQGSSGLLITEQSSGNLVYKNSLTHGGFGLLLEAGKEGLKAKEEGSNDNIVRDNNFSFAVTNGIEANNSRNQFIHNRIFGCVYGFVGRYSFETLIEGNQFRDNRIAIMLTHGNSNTIYNNLFLRDKTAIRLWAGKEQLPTQDQRRHNYLIATNSFNSNQVVFDFQQTDSISGFGNTYNHYDTLFLADSILRAFSREENQEQLDELNKERNDSIPYIKTPRDPFRNGGRLAGQEAIRMTAWGPYSYDYPFIWNSNPGDTSIQMDFQIMGPPGKWRIISLKGIKDLSISRDSLPSRFSATRLNQGSVPIEIVAEFKGAAFTDQFGNRVPAGKPSRFIFKKIKGR
jgi:parallel beta-helix repeat protein